MTRFGVRAGLFYSMLALGLLTLVTGLILYFWPHGQRAGRLVFSGANRTIWGEWHTYVSVMAIALIVAHLLENRKCVNRYVKTTMGGGSP